MNQRSTQTPHPPQKNKLSLLSWLTIPETRKLGKSWPETSLFSNLILTPRIFFNPSVSLCAHRRDKNLSDILVKSSLQTTGPTEENQGLSLVATPLRNLRLYQPFADSRHPGRSTEICTTGNLIYVISCRKCSKLYIGETGRRLGDRFREHIRSVGANTDLPVGKHFSSLGQCGRYAGVRNLCGFQDNDCAMQHGSKINLPSQDLTTKWNEHWFCFSLIVTF